MERDDGIGLNSGSMLPWSAVPGVGLPLAAWMTRKAGYGFWQVSPFRGVTVAGLKRTGIPVRFVEPAWNPTTFRMHLQGVLGAEGSPTLWQDPLFFPDPRRCDDVFEDIVEEFQATPIWHHAEMASPPGLVEIHPGLRLTAATLVARAESFRGWKSYVVDLRHLRRVGENGFDFGPWYEALAALLPFAGLLHVQAYDDREWRRFLAGEPNTLAEMLRFVAKRKYEGPFVVEYNPMTGGFAEFINPFQLVKSLARVRERVEEII